MPLVAAVLALGALIAGFAAPLLLAPAGDGALPVLLGVLAWLVPAAALGLGLAAIGPRVLRRGSG